MMLKIKRWLAPPVFPDDEPKTRRAILLNFALLTCMVLALCLIAGNLAGGTVPAIVTGLDIGSVAVCLVLRRWAYQGRVGLASGALLAVGLVGITMTVVRLGTIRTPSTGLYMLLVIFAGLMFDLGGMIAMTVVCSLVVACLIIAENTGLLPSPDYAITISQWVTYTVLFAWVGSLTLSSLQSTRRALARAEKENSERKQAEEALGHSQEETAHANRLLLALSQAAQAVQRSRTPEEVYRTVNEQMAQLGYKVTAIELDDEKEGLRIAYLNYDPDLLRKAEKITGLSIRDYHIPLHQEGIYQRILAQGEAVYNKDATVPIVEALPEQLRALSRPIIELFHFGSSIFAPLTVDGKAIGILIVTGIELTEADKPAITAFANQAAIAMQNARLYEQAQQEIAERKQAKERIQRQLEHLTALSAIDRVIAANYDLKLSLSGILTHVIMELGIDAADILILNPSSQMLEYSAERGFRTNAIRKRQVRLGEGYTGRAALERQLVQIPNLRDEPNNFLLTTHLMDEDFVCYYGVPLIAKGQVKGILEVFHRTALEPDPEWLDFLNTLAGQAAIAIENSTLFESLQASNLELALAYDATIEGWSRALDLRDKETEGHTQRVTEMTVKLGRAFGLSEMDLVQVRWGALLHDIGKMGIPDEILHKPASLTDEEWVAMKKHPYFAYAMLSPIRYLRLALDIPYCHHEKWDGTGYPKGLKGEQIPLIARIFAVVDVWDALKSDRPYRLAWTDEKVLEYIRTASGTHFDPQVVDVFMQIPN